MTATIIPLPDAATRMRRAATVEGRYHTAQVAVVEAERAWLADRSPGNLMALRGARARLAQIERGEG